MWKASAFHLSIPLYLLSKGHSVSVDRSSATFVTPRRGFQNQIVKARMALDQGVPHMGNNPMYRHSLYPRIDPYFEGELEVSDLHTIYYELSGNPNGLPVVFIHGGPGGGTEPTHRRFFDPNVYKIILIDQRGCGRSRPIACVEQNTTWDLINDMERVREAAGVQQWVLFGGSWGSTLALAYAQTHPNCVVAMILRGIFVSRRSELKWLYERGGAAMLYPEAFERYLEGLPPDMRTSDDLMKSYQDVLSREDDGEERRAAAAAWSMWEHRLSNFPRKGERLDGEDQHSDYSEEENLAFSRIENHFFVYGCFFKSDGFLLSKEQMAKIDHIKTCVVQGRWDMVCPRKTAYDLSRMFKEGCCDVTVVDNAGHSAFEPGIEQALLKATDDFGREFGSTTTGPMNR